MAERVRAQDQRETLTIYTLKWQGDAAVGSAEAARLQLLQPNGEDHPDEPESAKATVYCRVFLDDAEIVGTVAAHPHYSADFTTVTLELAPASVQIVECDAAGWKALG